MLGLRFSAWRLETEFGRQIEWLRLVLQQDVQQLDFPGLVPKMTEKGLPLQRHISGGGNEDGYLGPRQAFWHKQAL